MIDEVKNVWDRIENEEGCGGCPLLPARKSGATHPLLFKISSSVNVIVVTEGPTKIRSEHFIASVANHPTFTFLQGVFGGRFRPAPEAVANVYWTHQRKCFLQDSSGNPVVYSIRQVKHSELSRKELRKIDKIALRKCRESFLKDEIQALLSGYPDRRKIIVAVGDWACKFFVGSRSELAEHLEHILFNSRARGIFRGLKVPGSNAPNVFDLVVLPHPSGNNFLWGEIDEEKGRIIEELTEIIREAL